MHTFSAILVICFLSNAVHATQYTCTSVETCQTHTGCEAKKVPTLVTVSDQTNEIVFGNQANAPQLQRSANSYRTLHVGTSGAHERIGAATLVIFNSMDFVFSSTVEIQVADESVAIGILVRGNCEED